MGYDYTEYATVRKAEKAERIAVVGAGPAGLEAAITAAAKGHKVVLFEKADRLGGLMYYVGKPNFKIDYRKYLDYLLHMVEKSQIEVRLNTEFTEETAKTESFDKIIAATGSEVLIPHIEGVEHALNPLDILDGKIPDVKHFVVCGAGLVGCEVSMHLTEMGYKVTMLDIVPDAHGPYSDETVTFTGDAVICALGLKSVNDMAYKLKEQGYSVEIIGDAYRARKILDAVHEGFHAGRRA